jgi:hypothetical protein
VDRRCSQRRGNSRCGRAAEDLSATETAHLALL